MGWARLRHTLNMSTEDIRELTLEDYRLYSMAMVEIIKEEAGTKL